jgi:hypothetical protein
LRKIKTHEPPRASDGLARTAQNRAIPASLQRLREFKSERNFSAKGSRKQTMCMTQFSPQAAMTGPLEGVSRRQKSNPRRIEPTGDRKQPLRMKWVEETDESGIRRLRMHWTVARSWKSGQSDAVTSRA